MVPTNLIHIVVGAGRGMWDRTVKKINEKPKEPTSHQVLGRNFHFLKNATKLTALARSIVFEKCLDRFVLKNKLKSKDWVKNPVLSLPLIEKSAACDQIAWRKITPRRTFSMILGFSKWGRAFSIIKRTVLL